MKRASAILIVCCMLAVSAAAALQLSLTADTQNAARGTEIVFAGTLANTSATARVFLNNVRVSLTGGAASALVLQPNDFFAHVPGILLPGETYTGPIFRIALNSAAAAGDFSGTILLDGGADIFAAGNLASASFTVLSPEVGITAADPNASEFGPDAGSFTITRTGSTAISLVVAYAITGTAVNGTTYATIPAIKSIAAGASSVAVAITPIADDLAQGDRLATLTLSPSAAHNVAANNSATVTIHDKPADAWRWENFGAEANDPAAADLADWDGDGIRNVVEYGLKLGPKIFDQDALPLPFLVGDFLQFSYVPNPAATDVSYLVESTTDFIQWSAADVEVVLVPNPNPPNRVTVRYRHPVSLTEQVFLRLSIVR